MTDRHDRQGIRRSASQASAEREAARAAARFDEHAPRVGPVASEAAKPALPAGALPAGVGDVARSPGRPLQPQLRARMERGFGADFSQVRVHTDEPAQRSARDLGAKAYTVGHHIAFGRDHYAPDFHSGQRLLAHELGHMLQQSPAAAGGAGLGLRPAPAGVYCDELPPAEAARAEAEKAAEKKPTEGKKDDKKEEKKPEPPAEPAFADTLDYGAIAKDLFAAMDIVGTDEEAVYFALNRLHRDQAAIDKLKKRYKDDYKTELIDEIRDEFSGSELQYALQLINEGDPDSPQAIAAFPSTGSQWRDAALRLKAAFFDDFGTDEEAVFAVLNAFGRRVDELVKLRAIYRAAAGNDLRADVLDEMSGSERDYALWLLGEQPIHREESKAVSAAREILEFVQAQAAQRAKTPPVVDENSPFVKVLKSRYLSDYFKSPSAEAGAKVVDQGIGRQMEGRASGSGRVQIRPPGRPWRAAANEWEMMGVGWLNHQQLPSQIKDMKDMPLLKNLQALPRELGAATDILRKENTAELPNIDIPALLGKANLDITDINADVRGGGRNISQLMHWATGVKYARQKPEALRELFLAYELWHLEGWDVFGQDALNDMIVENQGRMLGAELLKGAGGALKTEADLAPYLSRTFAESRAWVGSLLRMRRSALDEWILAKEQKPASIHWMDDTQIWPSLTVYQLLADGASVAEVKKSFMVESAIEIYTLIFEADEWDKAHGAIKLTPLEKALVRGELDKILAVMAKAEVGKASLGDLVVAKSAIDGLKGGE